MKISKDTLLLVKYIGLPDLVQNKVPSYKEALRFLHLAKLNKTPLLFLESLRKFEDNEYLESQLSWFWERHRKTLNLVALVSRLLKEWDLHYLVFKTLKPFPYTPADIDILLQSSIDLAKASKILKKNGFVPLDKNHYGLTMLSNSYNLNVDLTTEIAASNFIYLNKNLLFNQTRQVRIEGAEVEVLETSVDLVVVATHCMYKEQMYTLSDYYTFALSSKLFPQAIEFAENSYTKFALEIAFKLTYDITINAFGSNNKIIEILNKLFQTVNTHKITRKPANLPMKCPFNIFLYGLFHKIFKDSISRNSLPITLKSSLEPRFLERVLNHIIRKRY